MNCSTNCPRDVRSRINEMVRDGTIERVRAEAEADRRSGRKGGGGEWSERGRDLPGPVGPSGSLGKNSFRAHVNLAEGELLHTGPLFDGVRDDPTARNALSELISDVRARVAVDEIGVQTAYEQIRHEDRLEFLMPEARRTERMKARDRKSGPASPDQLIVRRARDLTLAEWSDDVDSQTLDEFADGAPDALAGFLRVFAATEPTNTQVALVVAVWADMGPSSWAGGMEVPLPPGGSR
ncbi:MAG: hypothetical protein R2878_02635 [Thermoleophilia bacterium]